MQKILNKINSIQVKFISSACILTSTQDVVILHDPWFTDGAFDGSWFTFPKIKKPINLIGNCDYIYISHIHADHFDPYFLKSYFKKYGVKIILIANFQNNYLEKALKKNGFKYEILTNKFIIGRTQISIFPFITDTHSIIDIDSFIIIDFDYNSETHRVVNLNDCNTLLPSNIISILSEKKIDILLTSYTDASSYPQCYFDINDPILLKEKIKRKKIYLKNFKNIVEKLKPQITIPFAGEYILGGKLSKLNSYRATSDAIEAKKCIDNGIVLNAGGYVYTKNNIVFNERTKKFTNSQYELRINEIKNKKMPYDNFIKDIDLNKIPMEKLLYIASKNITLKSEINFDYFYKFITNDLEFIVNINNKSGSGNISKINDIPLTEIFLSTNLLFGLLIGRFNWNNIMLVASHLKIRRTPNYASLGQKSPYSTDINRKIADSLNFFII